VETITAILRARGRRRRVSITRRFSFLRRVARSNGNEIESLIKCGAFDEVNDEVCRMTRPELLWRWNLLQAAGKGAPGRALLDCAQDKGSCCGKKQKDYLQKQALRMPFGVALAEMQTPEYTLEQKLR